MNAIPVKSVIVYQAVKFGVLTVQSFNDERDSISWLPEAHVIKATSRLSNVTVVVPLNNVVSMTLPEESNPPAPPAPSRGRTQAA